MTTREILNAGLQRQILETNQQQARALVNAADPAVIRAGTFVYFAAFDGTNNDLTNTGNIFNTNVAQLYGQVESAAASNPDLRAGYYPGPGTPGTLNKSDWLDTAVTQQVINAADQAYEDFAFNASAWLENHPGAAVTAMVAGFSRGNASAAIFSQMLFERGLVDPNVPGVVLVPPGRVKLAAGVLFDPVMTGVKCNLAFAPNAHNLVQIRAQDEYRQVFRAADYSAQPCVTLIDMLGNHCDIGGGYDNGIAALTLDAATKFLRKSGLSIADVDDFRLFAGVDAIAIHSEEIDDWGNPLWEVYDHFRSVVILQPSPRVTDQVATPATQSVSNGATVQTMILYNGNTVAVTTA